MSDDGLSDEEKALFRKHMGDVRPLKKTASKVGIKTPVLSSPTKHMKRIKQATTSCSKKEYFLSDFITETIHAESVLSYTQPSVPAKQFKSLKKGEIAYEARLDLHGMQVEMARESLCCFIEEQILQHKRCLLIIHGKGGQ